MSTQCDYLPEKTAGMELLGNSQEGGIVPQGMRVQPFLDARSLGGISACMPNHFRRNRLITGMVLVAWKQPLAWLAP